MTNIIYLAFGTNPSTYLQTHFSIQTLLVKQADQIQVHVVTDHPEYFEKLSKYIDMKIHIVSSETIKEWMWTGFKSFIFRAKQKAIELVIESAPQTPLIFLDSDTFIYNPLDALILALTSGKAVMHEQEGLLSQPRTKTERHVWKRVGNKVIGETAITVEHAMWNAGVIGIPVKNNKQTIKLATQLSDELSERVERNTFVEQMSFSIILSDYYGLVEAKNCIAHYWGNKDGWDHEVRNLYLQSHMQQLSFDDEMALIRNFDFSKIPFRKQINNTRVRLNNKINKAFPDKNFCYVTA